MKRAIKKKSNLYSYLDAAKVLESGTEQEIAQARKQYWREYKKQWKNERRKKSKSFEIIFNLQELKIVIKEAEKHHTSTSNYIKQSVLANSRGIIDRVVIGELRELLVLHHNSIQSFTEEDIFSPESGNQLLEQISQIEKKVFDFFESLNGKQ